MMPWREILYHCLFFIMFFSKCLSINGNNATATITSDELTGLSRRVMNGTKATWGRFKYIVSLRRSETMSHACGGCLLSEKWVLTAAHCLTKHKVDPSSLTIIAGDIQLKQETHRRQKSLAEKLIQHPKYSGKTSINDIALLSLKTSFQFNEYVTSIPMASTLPAPNTLCTVAGWGQYEPNTHKISYDLLYMDVPLLPSEVCKRVYPNRWTPCRICAGYLEAGSSFCEGDSGGPLECNGLLTGIVSGGLGCSSPKPPGLYSKVPYFKDWINEILKADSGTTDEVITDGTTSAISNNCSIAINSCTLLLLISMSEYILSS